MDEIGLGYESGWRKGFEGVGLWVFDVGGGRFKRFLWMYILGLQMYYLTMEREVFRNRGIWPRLYDGWMK